MRNTIIIILVLIIIVLIYYNSSDEKEELNNKTNKKIIIDDNFINKINLPQKSSSILLMPRYVMEQTKIITPVIIKEVNPNYYPIVIVPGLAASVLYATGVKPSVISRTCDKTLNNYQLWSSIEMLLPDKGGRDCWKDNFVPRYDNINHKYSSAPGLTIESPKFGSTFAMDYLLDVKGDEIKLGGVYFGDFTNEMHKLGYLDNINLRGAPYDFRIILDNDYYKDYMVKLKNLIEETYNINNNTPIIILGHSLGGVMVVNFLVLMSQEWKDKYIKVFVSACSALGGAPKALKMSLSGDDVGIKIIPTSEARSFERILAGGLMLYPDKDLYTSPIITIGNNSYDTSLPMLNKLFTDEFKDPDIYNIIENLSQDKRSWKTAPGVKTYILRIKNISNTTGTECIYNYTKYNSLPTIINEQVYYKTLIANNSPTVEGEKLEDMFGDTTVPYISLKLPVKLWPSQQTQEIKEIVYESTTLEHKNFVYSDEFINFMKTIINIDSV